LYVASITEHHASVQKVFLNSIKLSLRRNGKPRNLENFAVVHRGILWSGLRNLAKFTMENCGP